MMYSSEPASAEVSGFVPMAGASMPVTETEEISPAFNAGKV